jgi:hypothetical protein
MKIDILTEKQPQEKRNASDNEPRDVTAHTLRDK